MTWLVAGSALVSTPPAFAQNSGGSAYSIGGIDVDVVGPNTQVARMAGFRIAQRKAWPQLWSRLTGLSVAAAPRLSDAQLDGMVSGIESQGERFSATRYIARLGVVFDRSRASGYLGAAGAGLHSPPMLLLPMLGDGSAPKLYQGKTPWLAAWVRFRDTVTPLDYVLASGSASDNMLLTGWQVHRPDRSSWRNILTRYDAVQVLTAEARLTRSFPGGPVTALFIARQGPDAGELGRFTMTAATPDGLDAMFDAAVRQIDEIYAIALRSGRLQSEPDLSMELAPLLGNGTYIGAPSVTAVDRIGAVAASVEAAVATPDSASAAAIEAELRRTPGVTAVTITSLSLGGTSRVLVGYDVARDSLEYALDGKGLRLTSENGLMVLRRRLPEDLPVPPPKPPVAKPPDGGETAPPEVRAIPSATPPMPPT
ncbi:MAG: heavy-metal-associated domain-containing protein [Sandarakinorhabdus sp.]|nr:heavy-metal-associated domain-containing protein [Sandarakinorhabdus sp.]